MKTSRQRQLSVLALVGLLLATLILSGCVDTRYTIRQIDQHPAGQFNTVETSGERVMELLFLQSIEPVGINFWNCQQFEDELVCERICDDEWDRICAPELRNEFGRVSKPNAGVVLANYIARTGGGAAPGDDWDVVPQEEGDELAEETELDGDEVEGEEVQ